MKKIAAVLVLVGALSACTPHLRPAPQPLWTPEVHAAIDTAFPEPHLNGKARSIVQCESGGNSAAQNGQYRGLFQLGNNYNGTISVTHDGNVWTPLTNALAARAAYNARGNWSAWSCA